MDSYNKSHAISERAYEISFLPKDNSSIIFLLKYGITCLELPYNSPLEMLKSSLPCVWLRDYRC